MMDTYSILREFADSWALLALFAFFVGAILFVWRPGSRAIYSDAGRVPFRHDDRPMASGCGGDCESCTSAPKEKP
jgi:cytochrome c oxidase cbb3-type subunit IV